MIVISANEAAEDVIRLIEMGAQDLILSNPITCAFWMP